jgi:hypothetical protein
MFTCLQLRINNILWNAINSIRFEIYTGLHFFKYDDYKLLSSINNKILVHLLIILTN